MANCYIADDVRRLVSIRPYLHDQGVEVRGNRCAASWRRGDDMTCAIYDANGENVVFDNKTGERLNIIDLCMRIEGLTFRDAVNALGERYGVTPANGVKRRPRKPKPKTVPSWVRVAWLFTHADDAALMSDAYEHLNKGGDYLTDADLEWARRVAGFIRRGLSLDDAIDIAAEMCRQLAAKEAA